MEGTLTLQAVSEQEGGSEDLGIEPDSCCSALE